MALSEVSVYVRYERLCFFQTPEALSFPALVGISDINQISIERFFPNRACGKIFVLSHKSDFTSFP
jgi:hypothetical protein